jgi:hypothetical protein
MGTELTFEQRVLAFWSKVNKDGPIPPHHPEMSNCWIWEGCVNSRQYGTFSIGGSGKGNQKLWKAHRVAHFLASGVMPTGVVDHCNNRARRICVRGHPLQDPNLYHYLSHGHPKKRCLECHKMEAAKAKAKRDAIKAGLA